MYRVLITFHILFFICRILTDVSMEVDTVDTDNDNISFLECKIYGRTMVDKGENFEQNTSDKTTIWMHSSGNQTEWVLLLGCYNLSTLNELNFTYYTVDVDLTSSSHHVQLQECITLCHKVDNMRRYVGLQDNMCFCYENNDATTDSDCVPHKCKGGSEGLCGTTNESVVLYYRGEFVKNYQERFCGELEENNKTSNNKDKRCQDELSYLCTENKGCYNLSTLNELNFTYYTVDVDLTSSSHHVQLQECITLCHKVDNMRRYVGLQDNMCFCYENNDVTTDSDCVPHKCKGGSESLCGTTNESVVLYYRENVMNTSRETDYVNGSEEQFSGEFVKNYQERFCGENIKTSNNKDKRCQDELSYLCTENKESTNRSCHTQVMRFEDRRNSTNRCLSTSNGIPITHILPKENAAMYQMGQFTCEIFDLMNLTSIEIASSCIKAANFIKNFTTEGNNRITCHLLQCSIPDNLICTTPSTGLYNNKNTNCSLQNCIIYIIIGLAVIVTLVVLVSVVVCKCRKKTKAANRELAPEEIHLNTIRTCDGMEQSKAENISGTTRPDVENIEVSAKARLKQPSTDNFDISDNLYSTAKPFQQTTEICDNVSNLIQPSTADINVHMILQPIIGTTEISSNLNTTVHPDTGTIYTAENNENQYNILDHTLLNTRVDNGNGNENAVYDQIKPSVVPTDKFAGSVYDSVASVHRMLDKLKK